MPEKNGSKTAGVAHPELDLHAFFRIVRRRWWILVLVPALVCGTAVFVAEAKTPRYHASTEVLLGRTQSETLFDPLRAAFTDPSRLLANQIRVLQSNEVADLVTKRLGYPATVDASAAKTEDVITITATDFRPARAAKVANAYADAFIEFRRASGASDNAVAQAEVHRQIDAAGARLAALDDAVNAAPPLLRDQVRNNQSDRAATVTQFATLQTQLTQLEGAANVDRGGAQLLTPAVVPKTPFEPKPLRNGLIGLVVGLMLAIGLTLLLDYLDNRIRDKDELERTSDGLPVLGLIPARPKAKLTPDAPGSLVVSISEPKSASAEAYRGLRTSIQFVAVDRPMRILQVTSPATSEGKTTTLVNLAVALARAGQRVIAVDCDLRRPRVGEYFGLDAGGGFTSVLVGKIALSKALREVPDIKRLRVLPAGPTPPNPSELLSGPRTGRILKALQESCDIVLIDSPPVLPVSDAAVLASRADATLMVVNADKTHRKQLTRALEVLNQVDSRVVGTVLNRVRSRGFGYGYGYGYSNYTESAKPKTATNGTDVIKPGTGDSDRDSDVRETLDLGFDDFDTDILEMDPRHSPG